MSKTHVIDGVTYVEVDRKAKVGEKIIVVADWYDIKKGEVLDVISPQKYGFYDDGFTFHESPTNKYDDSISFIEEKNYHVLEPLEDSEEPTPSVTVLLANLARRVSSLEHQLRDTQGNVEKLAEELATKTHELDDKVEMALDDIVTLDERSQVLTAVNKHYGGNRR